MRRYITCALLTCAVLMLLTQITRADTASDKKRALMATIKRIAILAPFFGTDTLSKAAALPKTTAEDAQKSKSAADPHLAAYAEQLRKLAEHAAGRLPLRVAERTPFEVVPADETARALKALDLTPESLFENKGLMRGSRFPAPNPETVRKLAGYLHVEAVLLTVLDEPRRTNGHYVYNLLTGVDYNEAHVEVHGGFYVMMADGAQVLYDPVSVVHPLTHIGERQFLLVDWMEAEDVMIEDLLDEWARYTPEKLQAANSRQH